MPAPSEITFSAAAIAAANTALLALIDADASAGAVVIYDDDDTALATYTLTDPAGTVDGTTGVLTLTLAADEVNASATSTATYADITDGADVVIVSLPCAQGTAPVSGYCVLNATTLVSGEPVTILSITFG